MNEDKYTIKTGHLDVGDGHKIYYQQWGNPKAKPTFFLHGGPGGGCKDKHKLMFEPKIHNVIFHDQRGSGRSTPFGSIENNTTQDLIEDIDKLRKKLKYDKIQIVGGSWGSFLSLAYATTYPNRVTKALVSAIFTATRNESNHILQGGLKIHYPDAWEHFIELVPPKERDNFANYYYKKMQSGPLDDQMEHVRRWILLESSAMTIDSDMKKDKLMSKEYDDISKAMAILGAHYFVNNFFIEDNFLFKNASILKKIPIVMVHGRFDAVCPPVHAYEISKAIGENCHLQIVPTSHKSEGAFREALRAYAWSFLA